MKMTFRWYGEGNDSITPQQIKQIPGVTGLVWALHSKQGAVYVPQFFDAAVGSYSDFTFVNLLPYGVQIHASAQNGVLTVLFCRAEEDSQ